MENSVPSSFARTGQALADKAADKAQSGIRMAHESAKDAGDALSQKIEDVRSEAGTVINKSAKRVQSAGRQARDAASDATDSILAYTKTNPVKALAIAAAMGAVLYAVMRTFSASRD